MKAAAKIFAIAIFIVMVGCQQQTPNEEKQVNEEPAISEEDNNKEQIAIDITESEARFALDDLIGIVGGSYEFDNLHRTLKLSIHDDEFYFIDGVPVLERNGEYLPNQDIYLIIEGEEGQEELFLPVEFLELAMEVPVQFGEEHVAFEWYGPTEKVGGPPETFNFDQWSVDQMVQHLSFLEKPIKHAEVSKIPGHLPGAPRAYRNGFHEGIDWYDFASGGNINTNTPVYAMGEGVVVRADHDFVEYNSPQERNIDLAYTAELGETPTFIFDRLRGRQVWVQYQGGVMNRFAHLSAIPENLQVGDQVDAETVIGYVGNSGTSGAVNQDSSELHLHQDLLIYGELFWKPLTQEEVVEVLERIWE